MTIRRFYGDSLWCVALKVNSLSDTSNGSALFFEEIEFMYVLVTYDVSTQDKAGRRRLRRIAKICLDYGQRVQNSVFELLVDPRQWAECKGKLLKEFKAEEDSLRFYYLGSNWKRKVDHYGTKASIDFDGPLIM